MPGIVQPESFPIRDPRDKKLNVGRIANPPRMADMGGLDDQGKWEKRHSTGTQESAKYAFPVDRATSVRAAKKSDPAKEI